MAASEAALELAAVKASEAQTRADAQALAREVKSLRHRLAEEQAAKEDARRQLDDALVNGRKSVFFNRHISRVD